MAETDEERELIEEAQKGFIESYDAESEMREEMIDDLQFSFGINQWDAKAQRERELNNRPCLTMDRTGDIVRKAMGSIRGARPSIKAMPTEGGDEETAEVLTDLIREIEYASMGHMVYMTAVNSQLRMGYGVWEIVAKDVDSDLWAQDLRLKRYTNPFRVWFDPKAQEYTKCDSRQVTVSTWMHPDMVEEKWGKKVQGGSKYTGERGELWYSSEYVRVMRVWRRTPVDRDITMLRDGRTVYIDQLTEDDARIGFEMENGAPIERKVRSFEVDRFNMAADTILDKPQKWPGKFIPLIPVYGEEMDIEGVKSYRGIVRPAKDPQRMYNYARTTTAEILAEQPRAPWLLGLRQVNKSLKELFWNKQNVGKSPFLIYDDETNPTPPQRVMPPVASQGYVNETIIAAEDIQRTTGHFDASLGAQSNEISGVAIDRRTENADVGTIVYTDNLSASMEHTGRVLVDLIPHYYDTKRVIRLRGEDDQQREVVINNPVLTPQGPAVQNDLTRGKYDVRIVVGPSYKTRRMEASQSMLEFLRVFPQAALVTGDLVASSQDWPGANEFAERLRMMLPPGILEEEDPEKRQAMMQQLQLQQQQLVLDQGEQQADIMETLAQARERGASTRLKEIEALQAELELAQGNEQLQNNILRRLLQLANQPIGVTNGPSGPGGIAIPG